MHAYEHEFDLKGEILFILIGAVLLAGAAAAVHFLPELNTWLKLLIFLVPYIVAGAPVLREALEKLFRGELLDEDFLMSAASIGALCIGEYPEAVFVMLFYRIGEVFEHYAVGKSRRSIAALMDIRPEFACIEVNGQLRRADPSRVKIGTVITVSPGERIPLDGVVVGGMSMLDTSALTGESRPRDVVVGQSVSNGCINLNGVLKIRVTSEYKDSTVARILELVEHSSERKSRRESLVTRFARIYTPVVVFLALVIAIVPPIFDSDWAEWLRRALVFLVISCPCALVVSVPLTFFCGLGCASRRGILIKGSNYLEALAKAGIVVLDKTGTVTEGSFSVTDAHPIGISSSDLITLAAAAESYSNHPIAHSLRRACFQMPDPSLITDVREIPGRGVSAKVCGRNVLVGNAALMKKNGISPHIPNISATLVHVAADGVYGGYIVIDDRIKTGAKEAVAELGALGIEKTVMLTGDSSAIGHAVGYALGVNDVMAELLPEDKVTAVEELRRLKVKDSECIVFVGDGVNDAPVLRSSDIGVAMGVLGSDAAIESADVVLMDDDIRKLPLAIRISRRTLRIAKQNIVFSLAVKFAILLLGVFGIADMWLAVFADVGVLIIALINATKAMKVKK